MEIVVVWFVLSVLVAMLAESRDRSGVGYFFLSLVISPLIALLIILVAGEKKGAEDDGPTKACPHCAERIKEAAKVCRYCNREVGANEAAITGKSIEALAARRKVGGA